MDGNSPSMRFKPGQSIVLQNATGAEVIAKPFFYTPTSGAPIRVELYTSDGVRLKCLDEAKGEYAIGEQEHRLRIKPAEKSATHASVSGSFMQSDMA
jgi:hypothetical protein